MRQLSFLSLILGVCAFGAPKAPLSDVTFYNGQAQVIFDLIKEPTRSKTFTFVTGGRRVGAAEKAFGDRISCTLYGRTEGFPTSPPEISYATCTLRSEVISTRLVRLPNKGGIVEVSGETAKALMGLLPGEARVEHDDETRSTLVEKTMGIAPTAQGVRCQKKSFDDTKKPVGYVCRIAWLD